MESKWHLVSELPSDTGKLPRDWFLITDGELYDVGFFLHGRFVGHRELTPTHWMELPELPEVQK